MIVMGQLPLNASPEVIIAHVSHIEAVTQRPSVRMVRAYNKLESYSVIPLKNIPVQVYTCVLHMKSFLLKFS